MSPCGGFESFEALLFTREIKLKREHIRSYLCQIDLRGKQEHRRRVLHRQMYSIASEI
jgi:hypothetical protein